MKVLLVLLLAPLAIFILFAVWASLEGPFGKEKREYIVNVSESSKDEVKKLKVISWNIAWGYGMGSEGTNYVPKSRQSFIDGLNSMAETIKAQNADIVLLQEVDFDSHKSHNIDQLKYLSDKLGMNRAYAVSWDLNYLPFPYWPVSSHFKKVSSGGGILSRFPITDNKVVLWDKPKSNAWWYNIFYLFRYSQIATVRFNGKDNVIVNSHLEAFDKTNRQRQARELSQVLKERESVLVVGGDFNTTPPEAKKQAGFEDIRDDYAGDSTYGIIASAPGLKDTLSLEDYRSDERKWFTFSSVSLSRKLDYIFVDENVAVKEFEVIQTPASDHLPVSATLEIPDEN